LECRVLGSPKKIDSVGLEWGPGTCILNNPVTDASGVSIRIEKLHFMPGWVPCGQMKLIGCRIRAKHQAVVKGESCEAKEAPIKHLG